MIRATEWPSRTRRITSADFARPGSMVEVEDSDVGLAAVDAGVLDQTRRVPAELLARPTVRALTVRRCASRFSE